MILERPFPRFMTVEADVAVNELTELDKYRIKLNKDFTKEIEDLYQSDAEQSCSESSSSHSSQNYKSGQIIYM